MQRLALQPRLQSTQSYEVDLEVDDAVSFGTDLTPFVGSLKSLYEVVIGEDSVTGDNVDRWWSAAGIIPYAKLLKKFKNIEQRKEALENIANSKKIREGSNFTQNSKRWDLISNIPKDWIRKPSNKGDGIKYIQPGTKNSTYIRIQKGNPNSSAPGQRHPYYVRWQKNGKSLDKNGNITNKDSYESHIPLENFHFKPELFK